MVRSGLVSARPASRSDRRDVAFKVSVPMTGWQDGTDRQRTWHQCINSCNCSIQNTGLTGDCHLGKEGNDRPNKVGNVDWIG